MNKLIFLLPTLTPTGAERVTINLIRGLLFKNIRSDLFVMRSNEDIELSYEGIPTRKFMARTRFEVLKHLFVEFRQLGHDDYVVAIMEELGCLAVLAKLLSRSRCRIITISHSTPSAFLPRLSFKQRWVWILSVNILSFGFYRWIMVSRCMQQDYPRHVWAARRDTRLAYNASLSLDYSLTERYLQKKANDPKEPVKIVLCGRMIYAKGFDFAIEAAAILQKKGIHIQLLLVGDGPERSNLELHAKKHLSKGSYKFFGFVYDPLPIMLSARIYWHPSRWDGLPTALIEAISIGLPSIAFACRCGPDEILWSLDSGILLRGNDMTSEGLARETCRILENSALEIRLSFGATKAAKKFTALSASEQFMVALN